MAAWVADRQATIAAASGKGAEDDKWQARNLTASLSRALRRSCGLGSSDANSLYAGLWRDVNPLKLPSNSTLPSVQHLQQAGCEIKRIMPLIAYEHGSNACS